jgi:xylose isomerase
MTAAFPDIPSIPFEGPDTTNLLAFRHYNPEEVIDGTSMRDHLRFASAYWHTMRNPLADPFGIGTALMPWDDGTNSVQNAQNRAEVFFEFLEKIGIDYFCFHDRDIAPEGSSLSESEKSLDAVVGTIESLMKTSGKKLLWGTACLFIHPRYASGAGTSPNIDVFCYGAAQIKSAMDATHRLGGLGYVFWGGREGYGSLINTDMKREREHLARLLHMAVDYKKEIGFKGQFHIEPKPQEPTTHQYDSDAEACLNFLREFGLLEHFKLNIETNHAWLAGHSMEHELQASIGADALGSVDANMGERTCGWDTDCFPTDPMLCTQVMLCILEMGGLKTGGLNFDAKRRRESFEPIDLFYSHIAGMDAFALGLKIAAAIRADGRLHDYLGQRYASWDGELGGKIERGEMSLAACRQHVEKTGEPTLVSGRQEMLENLVNSFIR